jgi:hypothetical protein
MDFTWAHTNEDFTSPLAVNKLSVLSLCLNQSSIFSALLMLWNQKTRLFTLKGIGSDPRESKYDRERAKGARYELL